MNSVIMTGIIANDIESRTTQNGVSQATFRLAVQRRYKNAEGKRDADFFQIVAWRQTADFCTKYMHKGVRVLVAGVLQTRSYDAQDGSKRYVTEINADTVEAQGPLEKPKEEFTQVEDAQLPWEE